MAEAPQAKGSIRAELVVPTSVLFAAAVLVAVAAVALVLPLSASPAQTLLSIGIIVGADLLILFLFLRSLLRRTVIEPLDRIVTHAERIASGDLDHRIPRASNQELDRIVGSVNALADRLIDEQDQLALNVASLDQTNRALTETSAELVRAARLASVGTLAGGVAHEIGNPLGALRGFIDVAERRQARGEPTGDVLESARDEVARIDRIVRHILAFGGPGEQTTPGDFPLLDPLEAARRAARREPSEPSPSTPEDPARGAAAQTIAIEVEARGDGPLPGVRAEMGHLDAILGNLLANAVRATRQAGRSDPVVVRLEAVDSLRPPLAAGGTGTQRQPRRADDPDRVTYEHRRRLNDLLRVSAPPPADAGPLDVLIQVMDRGPGIDPEDLPRLFDPFFTTQPPGQGTGMGLPLAARVAGELGGSISARPREGGGARFEVRLPGVLRDVLPDVPGAPTSDVPTPDEPATPDAPGPTPEEGA